MEKLHLCRAQGLPELLLLGADGAQEGGGCCGSSSSSWLEGF
jgi:hypothetical protein